MTAATGVDRQAQDYLAAVERELADLSAEDRSALLEDLALHLEALAADDDDRPLDVRLGTAAAYAADLRAAAGLPARASALGPAVAGLRDWLDRGRPVAHRVAPAARATRRLLAELRPAWWVLRGYLLVLVPCLVERDGIPDVPVPAPLDSHVLGVSMVVAAVVASVALGRRALPRPVRVLVSVAGVGLVLGSFVVGERAWTTVTSAPASGLPAEVAVGEYPLLSRYGPVTDVFPYAADGTPLQGVLLYDQDGRPLHVGFQQWWADGCARVLDQPVAADGVAVPNSYPQVYVLHPEGVRVDGPLLEAGQACETDGPRPEVPLPEFPADESGAPAAD